MKSVAGYMSKSYYNTVCSMNSTGIHSSNFGFANVARDEVPSKKKDSKMSEKRKSTYHTKIDKYFLPEWAVVDWFERDLFSLLDPWSVSGSN